jgi:hypothetical protein
MAHALDAAMTLSLHFEAHWRRAVVRSVSRDMKLQAKAGL